MLMSRSSLVALLRICFFLHEVCALCVPDSVQEAFVGPALVDNGASYFTDKSQQPWKKRVSNARRRQAFWAN
jgi:succinate dehydrogenase/fumarate reductase-like Fe-S protein